MSPAKKDAPRVGMVRNRVQGFPGLPARGDRAIRWRAVPLRFAVPTQAVRNDRASGVGVAAMMLRAKLDKSVIALWKVRRRNHRLYFGLAYSVLAILGVAMAIIGASFGVVVAIALAA